jgi:hypothetical protein
MHPLISVCIPTYNRADILDYCLNNLGALLECGKAVEVVISDNGSTDHTRDVVDAHCQRNPMIRAYRFPENRGPAANWFNVFSNARGTFIFQVADDDSIIVENVLHHVQTMEQQPDLVAIFADWIAWDDKEGREVHRYFGDFKETVSFGPANPLELANFMLERFLMPETAIFRRDALLQARLFHGRSLPFYLRMYRLSRLGRVAFDPLPFYREHRVLNGRLQRTHWMNMNQSFHMIGDELRLSLEEMVLMALQDTGITQLPSEQAAFVLQSIERILHGRIRLEADRAGANKNWIGAVELRRRYILWHGPGPDEETRQDVLRIVLPAAFQAVQLAFESLSNAAGISFRGFESNRPVEFFSIQYPATPILPSNAETGDGVLVVHRDEQTLAQDPAPGDPSRLLVLQRLMDAYRITRTNVDLAGL